MKVKNKNGFITIYVMIAMVFFVVFMLTVSISVSKKLNIQQQSNAALYNIYNRQDNIIANTNTIPIYTKEEFITIMNWISENDEDNLKLYINGYIYELKSNEEYSLELKTDLYLEEYEKNAFEEIIDGFLNSNILNIGDYNIYIDNNGVIYNYNDKTSDTSNISDTSDTAESSEVEDSTDVFNESETADSTDVFNNSDTSDTANTAQEE